MSRCEESSVTEKHPQWHYFMVLLQFSKTLQYGLHTFRLSNFQRKVLEAQMWQKLKKIIKHRDYKYINFQHCLCCPISCWIKKIDPGFLPAFSYNDAIISRKTLWYYKILQDFTGSWVCSSKHCIILLSQWFLWHKTCETWAKAVIKSKK